MLINKVCAKCLQTFPIYKFERCKFTDDNYFRYCPECAKEYYLTYKTINWNNKTLEIIYEDITYEQFKNEEANKNG